MKNSAFLASFILYCGLFSQNVIVSHARHPPFPPEIIHDCMDRENITAKELMILDSSPVETIKLIGGNMQDFRNIGCFLACALQQHGDMTGSTMNVQTMMDRIHEMYHGHTDVNSFFANALQTCADSLGETDDECEAALTFHICVMEAFHNKP
ncbi:odorant binding protein 12 [Bombus fervidus]|uniref:odorant binding protein 12 n=1 Tax=Bombus fervidus TaxID=203811 RepID=UPI003AB761F7